LCVVLTDPPVSYHYTLSLHDALPICHFCRATGIFTFYKQTMLMDIAAFFLDLFTYILAGCVVAAAANWMFWTKYNSHAFRLKTMEARQAATKDVLPLRLQAYERLGLLVERVNRSEERRVGKEC